VSDDLSQIQCFSVLDCVAAGQHSFWSTTDGGTTWVDHGTYVPSGMTGGVQTMYCTSMSDCWLGGGESDGAGNGAPTIFQTTDGGSTWSELFPAGALGSAPYGGGIQGMSCLSTTTCIVTIFDNTRDIAYETLDGGSTWSPLVLPSGASIYSLWGVTCVPGTEHCLILGNYLSGHDSVSASAIFSLAFSSGGVATTDVGGVTVSAHGGVNGQDAISVAQYGVSPVGDLGGGSLYFDVAASHASSFSIINASICNPLISGASVPLWWDSTSNSGLGAWSPIVGDPGPTLNTSGTVPCLTFTLDGTTQPTIAQLTGTVIGVGKSSSDTLAPPQGVLATPGNSSATISWLPPQDTGGSLVTSYSVSDGSGHSCSTTGATSCTVGGLTNGASYSLTVTATNAGGASSKSAPVLVTPSTTSIDLAVQPLSAVWGQKQSLVAKVSSTAGTPSGSVSYHLGTDSLGTAPLSSGVARLQVSNLPVGLDRLTAAFAATGAFQAGVSSPVTVFVSKDAATLSLIAAKASVRAGRTDTLTATLVVRKPGTAIPTGRIAFYDGKKALGTCALKSGSCKFVLSTKARGQHTLTAVFGGSAILGSATSKAIVVKIT
jgi:hypothetical protein